MDLFLLELAESLEHFIIETPSDGYDKIVEIICKVLDMFCPLKNKIVKGNQNRFINQNLNRAIMTRSRLKNKYLKSKNCYDRKDVKANEIFAKIKGSGH